MKPAATLLAFAATVAALLVLGSAGTAAGAGWRPPVPGTVVRGFDLGANPFDGGRHRGVDFAAGPGTPVRAPCGGRVAVAGRVGSSGRVVTIRCGPWRVSHLPLATIAVRPSQTLRRGALLGTAAASHEHAGLHLGVRREGVRFGYVDPLRFLGSDHDPPLIGRRRLPRLGPAPRAAPPSPRPVPVADRHPGSSPRGIPAASNHPGLRPRGIRAAGSNPGIAPWPAWAGLALFLAGAGVRWRGSARRRRRPAPVAAAERVR